jgi:hypothetical protein
MACLAAAGCHTTTACTACLAAAGCHITTAFMACLAAAGCHITTACMACLAAGCGISTAIMISLAVFRGKTSCRFDAKVCGPQAACVCWRVCGWWGWLNGSA